MTLRLLFRKFFLVIILFALELYSMNTSAQANYEDVVYLKNGSIIHGMIIEQIPNESIKIKTADRNVFVFRMDEIQKITKEEVQQLTEPVYVPVPQSQSQAIPPENVIPVPERSYDKGYVNILEFTFGREVLQNHSNQAMTGSSGSFSQFSIG